MKKVLWLIVCLMTMVVSANAQNGWDKMVYDADELEGTESYTSYCYWDEDGMVVFNSNSSIYALSTNRGFFDYKGNSVSVIVGFYDLDGKLLKKETSLFYVSPGKRDCCFSSKEEGIFFKKYIEEERGYVRFIVPRYGKSNFDFKIPCMNN